MCTLHDFSVLKSNLFIRALLLDRILVTEKTTRTPRVHLVIDIYMRQTRQNLGGGRLQRGSQDLTRGGGGVANLQYLKKITR